MKRIELSKGYSALVWNEYYKDLNRYKWFVGRDEYTTYAYRHCYRDGKRYRLRMESSIYVIIQKDYVISRHNPAKAGKRRSK